MKETIKKSFLWGVVFLTTVMVWGYVYATVLWTVSSGDTLTADMWNTMTGNYNYSTSEVVTGKKWIDGKPIYRKVVTLASNPVADDTWHDIAYTNPPADVETLVFAQLEDGNLSAQTYATNSAWKRMYTLWLTNMSYILGTSMVAGFWQWDHVILEYTKTTD